MTDLDCDVCVVGSGAGGAPIAYEASRRGRSVIVLEKGPWRREHDFTKDEIDVVRRPSVVPNGHTEPQLVDVRASSGAFAPTFTHRTGWNFHNGALVGGASNLMSGFFHRMKPFDFRLRSEFGPIDGADVVDWPISYDDLEPYYARAEALVGVSGRVTAHPFADRRSTDDYPLPPTAEHPIASRLDQTAAALGLHTFPVARAVLSRGRGPRASCAYSGYCGSYGCATGAKGSARVAFLDDAVSTGRCEVRPNHRVTRLESDARGRVSSAHFVRDDGSQGHVRARTFVVACHAIESARLLLASPGPRHPRGLANRTGLVGRHLLFSSAGWGVGALERDDDPRTFVNRAFQDLYTFEDGGVRRKGGTVDFLFAHPNPINAAVGLATGGPTLLWGTELEDALTAHFHAQHLLFEVFADWLPHADSHVGLDASRVDRWGMPLARVRAESHPHNRVVVERLTREGLRVLEALGARALRSRALGRPATNLAAGTCRFGTDPARSVLDADCRAHDAENLYVTDGSFMPTGGSVPYTFTIYANALRVADRLLAAD